MNLAAFLPSPISLIKRSFIEEITETGLLPPFVEHLSQDRLELLRLWLSQLTEEELTALRVGLQALVRVTETAQPSEEQCQH